MSPRARPRLRPGEPRAARIRRLEAMSGHSKWSSIKHKKAIVDSRRGAQFSKLTRAITVAARDGGGDPDTNATLENAVRKAREASMPKDNIERAIAKGTGEGGEADAIESVLYEGYGPGGEAGAEDISTDEGVFEVITEPGDFTSVRRALEEAGVEMESAEMAYRPTSLVPIEEEQAAKLMRLIEALEDNDDVSAVHANFDVSAEVLERVAG